MRKWALASTLALGLASVTGLRVEAEEDKNCDDFSSNEEVMQFWYDNGYNETNDPHDLDRDNDNLPCEVSQSEYDEFVANKDDSSDSDSSGGDSSSGSSDGSTGSSEGGEMPNTASNTPIAAVTGALMAAAGAVLVFARKLAKK